MRYDSDMALTVQPSTGPRHTLPRIVEKPRSGDVELLSSRLKVIVGGGRSIMHRPNGDCLMQVSASVSVV